MITVHADLSATVETDTHVCHLPSYHPESLEPWRSAADAEAFAASIATDARYMQLKPPPAARRTLVTRTEYYGFFPPVTEAMIRIAASEEVTAAKLAAANAAEKQRLMKVAALAVMVRRIDALEPTATIDLLSTQLQQGLGLLIEMGFITEAEKAEIQQGV